MESIVSLFAQHGLLAGFAGVFVEQLGAPVPALPFMLLAGVATARGGVFAVKAVAVATLASMLADSPWFFAGRRFGRRLLASVELVIVDARVACGKSNYVVTLCPR